MWEIFLNLGSRNAWRTHSLSTKNYSLSSIHWYFSLYDYTKGTRKGVNTFHFSANPASMSLNPYNLWSLAQVTNQSKLDMCRLCIFYYYYVTPTVTVIRMCGRRRLEYIATKMRNCIVAAGSKAARILGICLNGNISVTWKTQRSTNISNRWLLTCKERCFKNLVVVSAVLQRKIPSLQRPTGVEPLNFCIHLAFH